MSAPRRQPLLHARPETELQQHDVSSAPPRTELIAERARDRLITWGLAIGTISVTLVIVLGLLHILLEDASQRTWFLFGMAYYIGHAWTAAWEKLMWHLARRQYVRVVVKRITQRSLYEAITSRLEAEAEQNPECFSSRDCEAYYTYDKEDDARKVVFSFWGVHKHRVSLRIRCGPTTTGSRDSQAESPRRSSATLSLTVEYETGENIICGRDSRVEPDASIVLWLQTRPECVQEHKQILASWCDECLADSLMSPPQRIVIMNLVETSSEWAPTWEEGSSREVKSSKQVGPQYYLERPECKKILQDAELWSHRSLRLYLVTGPPGVGKTEFTVWLAGRLGLPIYRLSLTTPRLTDALLAQLLSQNSLKHEQVLLQIDEFQEVLRRWNCESDSIQITPGGLNEVLQGTATLTRGVIVLTGLSNVDNAENKEAHPALYSRFHLTAELGHLDEEDIKDIFKNFLAEFVTGNSNDDWDIWQKRFVASYLGQPPRPAVSIRMLHQFLMAQITNAADAELGTRSHAAGAPLSRRSAADSHTCSSKTFHISEIRKHDFLSLICQNCTTHSRRDSPERVVKTSGD